MTLTDLAVAHESILRILYITSSLWVYVYHKMKARSDTKPDVIAILYATDKRAAAANTDLSYLFVEPKPP